MMRWICAVALLSLAGCGAVEFIRGVAETPEAQEGAKQVAEGAKEAVSGNYVEAAGAVAAGVVAIVLAALGYRKAKAKKEATSASA